MQINRHARLSIAPMMDWTDRHCRYLHRVLSGDALLYTEMVTSPALVRGRALHLLDFDECEHPVAVQLGGSDPAELAEAAAMAAERGFDEVNLNVGCPSDRVQSGTFGAVLMKDPGHVAACVAAMIRSCPVEVTVKCRIGVDDQDPAVVLPDFLARIADAGVERVAIHARKAWLRGLSPRDNREIPPLDHPLVYRMKERFPALHLSITGGIQTLEEAAEHLARGMDGVMIGRAAYQRPWDLLADVDRRFFERAAAPISRHDAVEAMRPHIARHLAGGGKLAQVTRHMLGLFSGCPGGRHWRRVLSERSHAEGAGLEVLDAALDRTAQAA